MVERIFLAFVLPISLLSSSLISSATSAQQDPPSDDGARQESLSGWQYYMEAPQPSVTDNTSWTDLVLSPNVFDRAQFDLRDLRLYSAAGEEIPFALRVLTDRSEKRPFSAREFNRTQGPDGASEVTLELEGDDIEHNELEIELPGTNYRRSLVLEGSDDRKTWREVHSQDMVDFRRGLEMLRDRFVQYSPSRYRFLRVRVYRDLEVDKNPVEIGAIAVVRRVVLPGERQTLTATVESRQPVPTGNGPGSSWTIALGGDQTPVDQIEVKVSDREFVRDFRVEAGGLEGSGTPLVTVASGVWRRRPNQPVRPLVVRFAQETRAARLKLIVTDNRNPPLTVTEVSYSAPARQVVFDSQAEGGPVRLYFGNLGAKSPVYDFARNLPDKLEPKPGRTALGQRQDNPEYVAKPLALTERWPWLIYVVLSIACVGLAGIAIDLSRKTIARHDEMGAEETHVAPS